MKDSRDRSVGVAVNFDATEEPELNTSCINILTMYEFAEFLEGPIRYR